MENKRTNVMNVAKDLFSKKGYKKVSMDEIALTSSVTKRTIYSYFKDKDELFKIFILEELESMKQLVETIDQKDISFIDKIHETVYQLLKYKKHSEFLNTISREATELKTTASISYMKVINDSIQNYIKEKIELAISSGYIEPCDVEFCTFIIYKIYIAILFEFDSSNKNLDEKQITDNIIKILKNGILN